MSVRLLTIEARRNVGLWFFPVILLISWWLLSAWGWIAFLWESTNQQLQASVVPFGAPAIAGAAAWMAGRDRRRGIQDLLATTPRHDTERLLTLWASTALWGVLAYAAFAAYMMGRTALSATWAGPELWPVVVALAAILAHAVWGFFFGSLVPSRFTVPVVAIAAMMLLQFLSGYMVATGGGYSPTWVTYLAPDKPAYDLAPWQALIYMGLTGAGLAALALRRRWGTPGFAVLAGSSVLAVAGVIMVWGEWPRYDPAKPLAYNGWGQVIEQDSVYVEPEPVCEGSPVTVCVYPQYQPVLDEGVASANRLAAPLLGLPGMPLRAGPEDTTFTGGGSTSMLRVGDDGHLDVSRFVDKLVADSGSLREGAIVNEAQLAVRQWLVGKARLPNWAFECYEDVPEQQQYPGQPTAGMCQATARLARLSPPEQRAWLETHYRDLRAGKLSVRDLP